MKKFGLGLLVVSGLYVFSPLLADYAHFGNQEWGATRSEVRNNLVQTDRFIAETDEFILAEYRFGWSNEKLLYTIHVFPSGTNRLLRGIYFSIPNEEDMVGYDEFFEAMNNGYGSPESRDSESARWVTGETIVNLRRGKIHRAGARNRKTSFDKDIDELLFEAISKFDSLQ